MDKKTFIKTYKDFLRQASLEPEEVRVGAGGTLLMMGLRKVTSDIDAELDAPLFWEMVKTYRLVVQRLEDGIILAAWSQDIDLHPVSNIEVGVLIDGVWCATPENTLILKKQLNRPKDQDDIKHLEDWLRKNR